MASPTLLSNAEKGGTSNVTTLSAFPIVAGSNRVLNVTVPLEASGDDHFPISVVIDGNNLVQVHSVTLDTGFHNSVSIWELLEVSLPANGNHDIVVTMASSVSMGLLVSATLFDDLEQTTPTGSRLGSGTAQNQSSVDADVTTNSESDNVILVGASSSSASTDWTAPTGFTQISNLTVTSFEGALSYKIESQASTLIPINYPAISSISRLSAASISYNGFTAVTSISVTGTAVPTQTEADIVTGGKTIILTLTGDTWVADGATFDAQRQAIIDGLVSAQSETNGFNAERSNLPVTDCVRTSDTVVTITLSALANYDITATETLTDTIPNAALVTSTSDIIATPTFTITAVAPPAYKWWFGQKFNEVIQNA